MRAKPTNCVNAFLGQAFSFFVFCASSYMSVVLYAENVNWRSCVFDTQYSFSHNDPDEC